MNAPSLELIGFSKRFGALAALDDVSVKVQAGSFHALLGENGAGKSTLVKCAMGYYAADEGQDHHYGQRQAPDAKASSFHVATLSWSARTDLRASSDQV